MPTALVAYANGSEDMEVNSVASILDRGGVNVIRAAVSNDGSKIVTLSHGLHVTCDKSILECTSTYDMIVVPGGLEGSKNCANCKPLIEKIQANRAEGRWVAAICAAPGMVLEAHGIVGEAKATGYPGCSDNIKNYVDDGTCIDEANKLVTGKGPAFSIDFGLACLSVLVDAETLAKVKAGMLR